MAVQTAAPHYALEQLSDGVYAAIASDGGAAISNAGLVDLGDSTLLVDTFLTPTAAEDLRADARRLTGRLPRWVVNTHYHNDHIWGNQVFVPEAALISTARTRRLIQTAGQAEYDDYRAITADRLKALLAQQAAAKTDAQRAALDPLVGYFRGLAHDFPRLQVTLPNLVFEDRLVLHGSRRQVELIAFADAHTGSDTLVYLPAEGIVFMSDLLFVAFHPYVGDGNPSHWLEVLRAIGDGTAGTPNATCLVPGHGPTGTRADLQRLAEYIQACQQIARTLAAEGKTSPADIAATAIPEAYAGWALPRFFYANLSSLLVEYQQAGQATKPAQPQPASKPVSP